ncbi:hypothetical protein GCM10029992_57340 [Glycomyces albus]
MSDSSDINDYTAPGSDQGTLEQMGSATPGVKQVMNSWSVISAAIESDEVNAGNAAMAVLADITNLGLEATGAFANPLGLLVGAGLDMVLALVEPLKKMITWLSGDPDEMTNLQGRWRQFGEVLANLSEEVNTAWETALATSQSPTTDAARDKVSGMAAAINGCAAEINQIESHLGMAQMLSKTIYEVVKAILSALVEQLIIYGLTALALAYPTAGQSITSFLMWGTRQSAVDVATGAVKVHFAQQLGRRLSHIGTEVLNSTFRQSSTDMLKWAGGIGTSILGGTQQTGVPERAEPDGAISTANQAGEMQAYMDVDPDEFDVAGKELRRLKSNADELSGAIASDTDTDYWTWGLACQGFVDGYNASRSEIQGDVALISPALEERDPVRRGRRELPRHRRGQRGRYRAGRGGLE